jgi:hypothetical protein
LVLEVQGARADGTPYESDFPVLRSNSGAVESPSPIYWSGLIYSDTPTPCGKAPHQACASQTSQPGS